MQSFIFNLALTIFPWTVRHATLWIILCHLPEKGKVEKEEIVNEIKERDRGERKTNETNGTEEI